MAATCCFTGRLAGPLRLPHSHRSVDTSNRRVNHVLFIICMYFLRNKQLSFVFMLYSQKKFIFNSPGSVIVGRIKDITRLFVCITLWAVLSQMKCLWWFQLNYPNHFAVYYLNSLRIIETDLSATRGIGGWVDVVKQFTGDHSYLCGHPLAALPCDAFTVNLLVTNLLKF